MTHSRLGILSFLLILIRLELKTALALKQPFPWYLFLLALALVSIPPVSIFVIKTIRRRAIIDEIFPLYKDGRLIKHFTRRLKPYRDDEILASMLVAVQSFVRDTLKGETGILEERKFGDLRFLISSGEYIIVAAVGTGKYIEFLKQQIIKVIEDIERDHKQLLAYWDGNLNKLAVLNKYLENMLGRK
jgi:hypothetical protein